MKDLFRNFDVNMKENRLVFQEAGPSNEPTEDPNAGMSVEGQENKEAQMSMEGQEDPNANVAPEQPVAEKKAEAVTFMDKMRAAFGNKEAKAKVAQAEYDAVKPKIEARVDEILTTNEGVKDITDADVRQEVYLTLSKEFKSEMGMQALNHVIEARTPATPVAPAQVIDTTPPTPPVQEGPAVAQGDAEAETEKKAS